MIITREEAEGVLSRAHSILADQELPSLAGCGLCNLIRNRNPRQPCWAAYDVIARVFNSEIPYYRDAACPPEWERGVWSDERQTALCLLGALSVEDILELCNG